MSLDISQAACRTADPRLFFPAASDPDDPIWDQARAICEVCPIAGDCLETAIARREPDGMWGGLAPIERERLVRRRRRHAAKETAHAC